jgi:hypothetical protein
MFVSIVALAKRFSGDGCCDGTGDMAELEISMGKPWKKQIIQIQWDYFLQYKGVLNG